MESDIYISDSTYASFINVNVYNANTAYASKGPLNVRFGTIENCNWGIAVSNEYTLYVYKTVFRSLERAMYIEGLDWANITNCHFSQISNTAFFHEGFSSTSTLPAADLLFSGNFIQDVGNGMVLRRLATADISGNQILSVIDNGLEITESGSVEIIDNEFN